MSLSKNQIVFTSAIAGFVVAAGALGWFLFDAYSTRGMQEEELESQTSAFQRFNDAAVFPSLKTIGEAKTNQMVLAAWLNTARTHASRGDTKPAEETPPIFKQRLTKTVAKMRSLKGGVQGRLSAPGFFFGFDTYLGEGGVLPEVKDVPRLAAQLDLIDHVVGVLSSAGALEIKEIRRIEAPVQEEPQPKNRKKKAKKSENKGAVLKPTSLEFAFVFTARPDAIVKTLNALSTDDRFIAVKKFAFKSTLDDIVTRMDADAAAKAAAAAATGTSRRRRRGGAAEAPLLVDPALKTDGVISDPEFGSPLQVDMTLEVWDFGSMRGPKQEAVPTKEAGK